MQQSILHIALVVRDYDEALEFYTTKLDFELIEDTFDPVQEKRWVVIAPPGGGGRVFLFLRTDDFWRDYEAYVARGVKFTREPIEAEYGTVAVFEDLYGNQWDLIQPGPGHSLYDRT
jgi:catechol 2,3-dioxygenase-like lactoylglutathione lyase family enzyme